MGGMRVRAEVAVYDAATSTRLLQTIGELEWVDHRTDLEGLVLVDEVVSEHDLAALDRWFAGDGANADRDVIAVIDRCRAALADPTGLRWPGSFVPTDPRPRMRITIG